MLISDSDICLSLFFFVLLIRSTIQRLQKALDPDIVLCLHMNSALSPPIVVGSTCCLLLNPMKQLPLRLFNSALLLCHHYASLSQSYNIRMFAFQVPSREIDKAENRFWTHWNKETKQVLNRYLIFTKLFYIEHMCFNTFALFCPVFPAVPL